MSSSRRSIAPTTTPPSAAAIIAMLDAGTELARSPVNDAETLVRPAEDERTRCASTDPLTALGIRLVVAPTPAIARDAPRHRGLNVSLADGFAIATAQFRGASPRVVRRPRAPGTATRLSGAGR
jgi:hypothetical protein